MPWSLSFSTLTEYDSGQPGISVPVILRLAGRETQCLAKIDTGSSDCIFRRFQGELLDLDIERGDLRDFSTATGLFRAYGHAVTLIVAGMEFDSVVYFAAHEGYNRNVLGRHGWLNSVRMGLVDYEGKLYLNHAAEEVE
ncbi:MAG TPA: hypothetical protein VJH03_12425 [Blastocatellia bacterium]|nr:hypothetical protein [Blastocatellia bacterium]